MHDDHQEKTRSDVSPPTSKNAGNSVDVALEFKLYHYSAFEFVSQNGYGNICRHVTQIGRHVFDYPVDSCK
jgi:hypothetical protein